MKTIIQWNGENQKECSNFINQVGYYSTTIKKDKRLLIKELYSDQLSYLDLNDWLVLKDNCRIEIVTYPPITEVR